MPIEEKLPEESEDSPLNPTNSSSPASGNSISTPPAVSRNFSQSVPCTSNSTLAGTKSSTKSSHHEVKFQMQKKSEGIFKNSDSLSPYGFHAPQHALKVYHKGESVKIEEVRSFPSSCCQGHAPSDALILSLRMMWSRCQYPAKATLELEAKENSVTLSLSLLKILKIGSLWIFSSLMFLF